MITTQQQHPQQHELRLRPHPALYPTRADPTGCILGPTWGAVALGRGVKRIGRDGPRIRIPPPLLIGDIC